MNSYDLRLGDCLAVMKSLPDNSVDAIVTDPPYGLGTPPDVVELMKAWVAGESYEVRGSGFMSSAWDNFVPQPPIWKEALRVLKPGGYLVAFSSTRTVDFLSMSLRFGGFEIRNSLVWVFSQGFPKGLNLSKAIDQKLGLEREVVGLNISADGRCRGAEPSKGSVSGANVRAGCNGYETRNAFVTAPASDLSAKWDGWNTQIKPAYEPIVLAQKPISEKTIVDNILRWGVGALNIGACRVPAADSNWVRNAGTIKDTFFTGKKNIDSNGSPAGRYPATFLHDGSDEVKACFPETAASKAAHRGKAFNSATFKSPEYESTVRGHNDSGGNATRFFSELTFDAEDLELCERLFYSGKISPRDRNEGCEKVKSDHPTVKPTELMRWLIRLITPPDGVVLDPFMGSGSTGKAAAIELKSFVGIELDLHYFEIAQARIEWTQANRATYAKKQPNAAQLPKGNESAIFTASDHIADVSKMVGQSNSLEIEGIKTVKVRQTTTHQKTLF